jgi:hypothetical protein
VLACAVRASASRASKTRAATLTLCRGFVPISRRALASDSRVYTARLLSCRLSAPLAASGDSSTNKRGTVGVSAAAAIAALCRPRRPTPPLPPYHTIFQVSALQSHSVVRTLLCEGPVASATSPTAGEDRRPRALHCDAGRIDQCSLSFTGKSLAMMRRAAAALCRRGGPLLGHAQQAEWAAARAFR